MKKKEKKDADLSKRKEILGENTTRKRGKGNHRERHWGLATEILGRGKIEGGIGGPKVWGVPETGAREGRKG